MIANPGYSGAERRALTGSGAEAAAGDPVYAIPEGEVESDEESGGATMADARAEAGAGAVVAVVAGAAAAVASQAVAAMARGEGGEEERRAAGEGWRGVVQTLIGGRSYRVRAGIEVEGEAARVGARVGASLEAEVGESAV